ncbi:MAG: TetR/AcrR family transcriptional regulator [Solirubrobacteraceae bacterium]
MPPKQTAKGAARKGTGGTRSTSRTKPPAAKKAESEAAGNGRRPVRRRREHEVMEAATKVFYERGYADASVQDVADELGILKGSLYHYIDTKEDLLYRLLAELHEEVEKILEHVAAEEGLDPLQRLALYVRRQVQFNAKDLPRVSVYYNDVDRLSEERRRDIFARRKVHERFVTELIEEAQRAGHADASLDARVLSNCIFGTLIWTYKWYHPGGKVSLEKLATVCSEFVLRGVIGAG